MPTASLVDTAPTRALSPNTGVPTSPHPVMPRDPASCAHERGRQAARQAHAVPSPPSKAARAGPTPAPHALPWWRRGRTAGSHNHPRTPGEDYAPAATSAAEPGPPPLPRAAHAPNARSHPPACPNHEQDLTLALRCFAAGNRGTRNVSETAGYAASPFRSRIMHTGCQNRRVAGRRRSG